MVSTVSQRCAAFRSTIWTSGKILHCEHNVRVKSHWLGASIAAVLASIEIETSITLQTKRFATARRGRQCPIQMPFCWWKTGVASIWYPHVVGK